MSVVLDLELDREQCAPGETCSGRVLVREGGRSRCLEVFLRLVEESPDYSYVARSVSSGPLHEGELEAGAVFPFAIVLPPDAPPNLELLGGRVRVGWRVDACSEVRGLDAHAQRPLAVEVSAPSAAPVRT